MEREIFQNQSSSPFGREIGTWLIGLLIFIFAGLLFSGVIPLLAWTEPSSPPPTENVSAPINVSDFFQTKYGALHIIGNSTNYKGLSLGKGTGENALTLAAGENLIYGRVGIGTSADANFLEFIACGDSCISPRFRVSVDQGVTVGMPYPQTSPATGDLNALRLCLNGDCISEWPSGGGIGGSGTPNYLAKWATSSSLADSVIYDNSGKVGIGTTEPIVGLHIERDNGIYIYQPSEPYFSCPSQGGLSLRDLGEGADQVRVEACGNRDLILLANNNVISLLEGNVGIDTTTPGYKLSVVDTGSVPMINIWNNSVTPQWTGIRLARGGLDNGDEKWFVGMNNSTDNLIIRGNASSDYIIISRENGNVGIGDEPSVLPDEKLRVAGQIISGGITASGNIATSGDIAASGNIWPGECDLNNWINPPCPNGQYVVDLRIDFGASTTEVVCCGL